MNVGFRYFFDVPVYRLTEDKYYTEKNQYIDRAVFLPNSPLSSALREQERKNPNENVQFRAHLHRTYGGCWLYNEIIGYIRLHFLRSQIRGKYYGVKKKRIVRTRKKLLEQQTWKLVPEIEVPNEATSTDIYQLVLEYVENCRQYLKGRYVDSRLLEIVGPHLDWRALYEQADAATRKGEHVAQGP